MREIRFKAWFKGNEEQKPGWIRGFNMVNFHHYFTKGVEPKIYRYSAEWALSEIILCQFTGLYDETKWEELTKDEQAKVPRDEWYGIPIYEGDILSAMSESIGPMQVLFEDYCFVAHNRFGRWGPISRMQDPDFAAVYSPKVIGNIYSNPTLLTP